MKKYLLIIAIIFLSASCNKTSISQPPIPLTKTQPTAPYLIKLKNVGGLCLYGMCEFEYQISQTGELKQTFFEQDNPKIDKFHLVTKTTQINIADFNFLKQFINQTNFKEILQTKFTDICPTAYDGQQNIFNIFQNNVEYILDSCKHIIQMEQEPFKQLYKIIINQ